MQFRFSVTILQLYSGLRSLRPPGRLFTGLHRHRNPLAYAHASLPPPLWVGDANERRIGTVAQYSAWGSCYVVYVFLLSSILLVVRPLWPCQLQCTITRYVCSCTGTSVISRYRPFELTARRVHGAVVAATSCNALKLVAACCDELTTRCNVASTQPAARLGSLLGEGLLLSACLIFLNLCLLFPFPSLLSLLVAV